MPGEGAHSVDLFQDGRHDGRDRHLDLRAWCDRLSGYRLDGSEIPLTELAGADNAGIHLLAEDPPEDAQLPDCPLGSTVPGDAVGPGAAVAEHQTTSDGSTALAISGTCSWSRGRNHTRPRIPSLVGSASAFQTEMDGGPWFSRPRASSTDLPSTPGRLRRSAPPELQRWRAPRPCCRWRGRSGRDVEYR